MEKRKYFYIVGDELQLYKVKKEAMEKVFEFALSPLSIKWETDFKDIDLLCNTLKLDYIVDHKDSIIQPLDDFIQDIVDCFDLYTLDKLSKHIKKRCEKTKENPDIIIEKINNLTFKLYGKIIE